MEGLLIIFFSLIFSGCTILMFASNSKPNFFNMVLGPVVLGVGLVGVMVSLFIKLLLVK